MQRELEGGDQRGAGMRTRNLGKLLVVVAALFASPALAVNGADLPVNGVITSGVGWRPDPFGTGKRAFHRGIDIAVPIGTPVHATHKGRVVLAGDDHQGHGNTVIIEQQNGDRTLFGHNSKILVKHGDLIEAGTVVALSGTSGRSTGPHVHYEERPGGRPIRVIGEAVVARQVARKLQEVAVENPQQSQVEAKDRAALEKKLDDAVDAVLGALTRSRSGTEG